MFHPTPPMPESDPAEPEDDPQPEPEKPRFLLPEGCKDLIDVLRLELEDAATPWQSPPAAVSSSATASKERPKMVVLPDPVSVRDLAMALRLKPFQVIGFLLEFNVFATINGSIKFPIARIVCARYGVLAKRAA